MFIFVGFLAVRCVFLAPIRTFAPAHLLAVFRHSRGACAPVRTLTVVLDDVPWRPSSGGILFY